MFYKLVLYAKVSRIQALFLSILPCILSYCYCKRYYNNNVFNLRAFIFTCLSFVLFNLSVNTISEYRDCINGIDDPNSPGTKYRLVTGIVPKYNVLIIGITSFIIASICGIFALYYSSLILLIPGVIGAGIALFYSEIPLKLKYRALGEICVFICYGLLLGFSTVFSLTNHFNIKDIFIFIPGGLLITCVLLANNIRDYYFDLNKTKTLVTQIGLKKSYIILYLIANLSFIIDIILVYFGILPKSVLYTLISYPILLLSIKLKNHPKFINCFGILFFISQLITIIVLLIK